MTEFDDIYRQYFKDIYKYVLSLCGNQDVAEDITQETFFKALKSIDKFDGKCQMRVWLCQIAKNTYFSHYKKESKSHSDFDTEGKEGVTNIEQRFVDKESAFESHKLLHNLSEPYKEVFTLRMFGELSFGEIAQLFGKTESWARVTYHRAKLKIKEGLS